MQSNRRTVKSSIVKSCKFCKDAGKSEEEYMSHFLRESKDPNSRITCPTLLAIECRYCFKKGHTVSKCQKLMKEKDGNQKKIPTAPVKKAWPNTTRVSPVNHFDLLSEFGDSDQEEEEATVTTCQECDDTITSGSSNGTLTYAQMLSRPAPVHVVTLFPMDKVQLAEVGSRISILSKARIMRSWADYSDSDEE
jgi:hypothetical protein